MDRRVLDCEGLYGAIDAERARLDMSWRDVARQMAVSPNTFTRLRSGSPPSGNTLCAIFWWLGHSIQWYITAELPAPAEPTRWHMMRWPS